MFNTHLLCKSIEIYHGIWIPLNLCTRLQFLALCLHKITGCDNWLINTDHVYFVHLSTDISVDISTNTPISQHIGGVSFNMSVDLSVDCRSICRPRCVARYIGRHIGRASVDMSTDTWPICRSLCWLRVVVRLSADMSIDRLPTFRWYFTATCVLVTVDII